MNPEIKTKWLEALRSGRYEQTTGYLHTRKNGGDQFCCLGVLCDVLIREGLYSPNIDVRGGIADPFEYVTYDYEPGTLPNQARPIVGWACTGNPSVLVPREHDDEDYVAIYPTVATTLADLNDSGKTFEEIADIIAAQL